MLSTIPLLAYLITCVTAPAAIVVALIGLRKPPSLTGRRRVITLALALLFSISEIVAWIFYGRRIINLYLGV